jgi:hypothetical protein
MEFVGVLYRTKKGHYYLYVVVEKFHMMCVLLAYNKTIKGNRETNFFFKSVQMHFGDTKEHHFL